MEYASGYLHIPKTGYFPYVTLPLFILGLMDKKIYRVILPFLGIGLLFYFLLRTDQFIFAGAGLLFSFQLVILSAANNIKSSYIKIFLAVLLIGNFVFFSEIYFRHFQKLYGGDRGYNEFNVMNTIRDSKVKVTYLSPRDDLKMLVPYYSKYYKMPTIIFLDQVKIITKEECQKENTLCIFNEGDLNRINKNKDDSQLKPILDPAGLKIYYSL